MKLRLARFGLVESVGLNFTRIPRQLDEQGRVNGYEDFARRRRRWVDVPAVLYGGDCDEFDVRRRTSARPE